MHLAILASVSDNGFHGLLPTSPGSPNDQGDAVISVPDNSTILNIVLHAMYEMSCAHYSPTFSTLASAVNRLPAYGISPKKHIVASSPLFALLLTQAPLYPLELYALAATFDLYDLAVSTSSHLLSFPPRDSDRRDGGKDRACLPKTTLFLAFWKIGRIEKSPVTPSSSPRPDPVLRLH